MGFYKKYNKDNELFFKAAMDCIRGSCHGALW